MANLGTPTAILTSMKSATGVQPQCIARVLLLAIIGLGPVTAWLKPVMEFVNHSASWAPTWWSYLQWTSLALLFVASLLLHGRDKKLCIITWCAFVLSGMPLIIPGYA